jgi:hypothetical protein
MISLLRNKKGMDYAALLVLVVIICLMYLYIQLQGKVNTFQVSIGESQIAVLNAYQEGEKALLYVDQSAKFSAYKALDTLAQRAGVKEYACADITEGGKKINSWTKQNGTIDECLALVQPYDAFNELMNGHMTIYSSKYTNASLPANNYEMLVQKDSITGTAISSASVYLKPPTQYAAFYVWFIKAAEAELKKAAIGEYAFKPSFTVPVKAELGIYENMKNEVKAFYTCTNTNSIDECAKAPKLFTLARSSENPDYLIATAKNPVSNPYGAMSDIVFAISAPVAPAVTA